jgi:choline dehydrogenase-like flavoprotein
MSTRPDRTPDRTPFCGYPTPGPQSPGAGQLIGNAYCTGWQQVQATRYDFIVIGTGPAGVAFIERTLARSPQAAILVLERGGYWLPVHVQNLPTAFRAIAGEAPVTYPWTRSEAMATSGARFVQAGMIPMLGGRSTCWNGWCPAPQPDQLRGWPQALIDVTQRPGFWDDARAFLHVTSADRIDDSVYGSLQRQLDTRLRDNVKRCVPSALDAYPAPLAVAHEERPGAGFHKFSTVGTLLGLQQRQKALAAQGQGRELHIVDRCKVELLLHDGDGRVTTLETGCGSIRVGDAKVVLAMGTIPTATLLMNSFGDLLPNAGKRYTGHFMSRFTARVRRSAFHGIGALELGAHVLHGRAANGLQYQVQISAFASQDPARDAAAIAFEAPDAVPSPAQLQGSEDWVLFVCTALGEIGEADGGNRMHLHGSADVTTNVELQLQACEPELALWDLMDEAACRTVEALAGHDSGDRAGTAIEYWIDEGQPGYWCSTRPPRRQSRSALVVDEASPLWIGADPANSVVGLDYRPHGVGNLHVTGAALFPTAGAWNPTLTVCGLAQDLADRLQR